MYFEGPEQRKAKASPIAGPEALNWIINYIESFFLGPVEFMALIFIYWINTCNILPTHERYK